MCQIWYRRYMTGILPIRRKTQNNQSINQSIKYGMTMSKDNKAVVQTQSHVNKPCKFDIDVKGQHCSGVMNVRDTSSPGDGLMSQIG